MGKVKILPEVQLSPVPTDGLLFAYKTKPNQMSSTMSRIYSDARNDKWKQGGKRYKERFPKYSQKVRHDSKYF